jgi:hypothetical protein
MATIGDKGSELVKQNNRHICALSFHATAAHDHPQPHLK